MEDKSCGPGTPGEMSVAWRRVVLSASGLLGLLIIVSLFYLVFRVTDRDRCQSTLRAIASTLPAYCDDWNRFPPNLYSLFQGRYARDARTLMCPAVSRNKVELRNRIDWMDDTYTYINWSNYYKTPNVVPWDYPLLYDTFMSNHGQRGINVARVDGHVFWDPGATWLRQFAASHPKYDIPVPK
jgi:prepilin-type processing-associated H-X9-DG protein